ncbi:hypothetical protein GCM10017687_80820 [Streptomyces echinatus]
MAWAETRSVVVTGVGAREGAGGRPEAVAGWAAAAGVVGVGARAVGVGPRAVVAVAVAVGGTVAVAAGGAGAGAVGPVAVGIVPGAGLGVVVDGWVPAARGPWLAVISSAAVCAVSRRRAVSSAAAGWRRARSSREGPGPGLNSLSAGVASAAAGRVVPVCPVGSPGRPPGPLPHSCARSASRDGPSSDTRALPRSRRTRGRAPAG